MSLETFFEPQAAEWVADQLGCERGFGECQALGVFRGSRIVGGIVYSHWSPEHETIKMSAASTDPRWLSRAVVRKAFEYPFGFCQMVMIETGVSNPARAIFRKLGATEHEIPRLLGRGRDGVICALTDDAWHATRYGDVNGQSFCPEAADSP